MSSRTGKICSESLKTISLLTFYRILKKKWSFRLAFGKQSVQKLSVFKDLGQKVIVSSSVWKNSVQKPSVFKDLSQKVIISSHVFSKVGQTVHYGVKFQCKPRAKSSSRLGKTTFLTFFFKFPPPNHAFLGPWGVGGWRKETLTRSTLKGRRIPRL